MSATSLTSVTYVLPNPDFVDPAQHPAPRPARVNSTLSFAYLTSFNLRTLSTNGASPGKAASGLLYTPTLTPGSPCINASGPYVPANATRIQNLPDAEYDLVALAPWLSPECVQEYFAAARHADGLVRAFLFWLPNDTGVETPPEVSDAVWGLGDGGSWKRDNDYPVYALPGASAAELMQASDEYSGNMTEVPFGHNLTEFYDSRDYVRLYVDIDTAGSTSQLPSLWVFLLVVLGILLAIIGFTSFVMHWLQRRRRQVLRRRVANGEVDLEALGIKRLTVPQEVLNGMPLYTYGTGAPVAPAAAVLQDKLDASEPRGSRPSAARKTSFRPTPLQQPTCAICLDDFVPAGAAEGEAEAEAEAEADEGTIVRELPCHHIFHPECVDTFLRESSSLCPICKRSALPRGYCPRGVTNAMVRRERAVRRLRERGAVEDGPEAAGNAGGMEQGGGGTLGERLRVRGVASMARMVGGRRVVSAPVRSSTPLAQTSTGGQGSMTEMMTPPPPSHPAPPPAPIPGRPRSTTAPIAATAQPSTQVQIQPPSTAGRREWARQRAVAMLGRRDGEGTPVDPDAEESRGTPGWRKALRGLFPSR
ncbi:hypothetical protein LTR53_006385 [Teratosphaeriaceae sp. CCFEE 6253]|nr:hypothetical protein LTR53_006385 [Teratosphaeriaceae sp. CCFEE 6253]